ncbi:hypothetical protein [Treponema endosymbiont of Eucomonympha sp.]|uniref:hypothetical protein n=1 Tax=Treponema endosymbiont of Eucomonympha sp. TaxID=1580831 RepID=UPI001396A5AB|nr:hypothetical protein [Treponema endosymbiont of Eucomonympha sp.]
MYNFVVDMKGFCPRNPYCEPRFLQANIAVIFPQGGIRFRDKRRKSLCAKKIINALSRFSHVLSLRFHRRNDSMFSRGV